MGGKGLEGEGERDVGKNLSFRLYSRDAEF